MEREQFTFYASFASAIGRIRKASDRCAAYDAVCAYALSGQLPDLDALPESVAIVFDLIRPVLDTAKRKAENGKRGGSKAKAKDKQSESKSEANQKQTASDIEGEKEKEKEKEVEIEVEIEVEEENECSLPPLPPSPEVVTAEPVEFVGELGDAFADWIAYKKERRETYKETGYRNLVSQVRNAAANYGDAAVAEVIRNSIASRYQGIVFDRLKKLAPQNKTPKNEPSRYDWMDKVVLE